MQNKLTELNNLYLNGDEQQKKLVEQQLIDLFPKVLYSDTLKQLSKQREQLVDKIKSCSNQSEINSCIKQLNELQQQIKIYAEQLQDYGKAKDSHKFLDSILEQIKK